jgi:hypothetical protein
MARYIWTFDSISFRVKSENEYDPWFSPSYEYTLDRVLGGEATYLDLGAKKREQLNIRAQFTSEATRDAMVLKLGITGTISNNAPAGHSATATLLKAFRVDNPSGMAYWLDCMFEYRP